MTRITDLYDLENKKEVRQRIMKSLICDIESLAAVQFKDEKFEKFAIKIRLMPIRKFEREESYL